MIPAELPQGRAVVMMLLLRALLLCLGACLAMASVQAAFPCGCQAQALYTVSSIDTLYIIAQRFELVDGFQTLQSLNHIPNANQIKAGQLLRIPSFSCDCPSGTEPGAMPSHNFSYSVNQGDQDNTIPPLFGNLTTVAAIDSINAGRVDIQALLPGQVLQIPINCFCGNSSVSDAYGLFGTYAVQPNDTLASLSHRFNNISQHLLQQYNPTVSFDALMPYVSILFIPLTNSSGQYPPLIVTSAPPAGGGASGNKGTVIGAAAGGVICFVVLGIIFWFLWARYFKEPQKGQGRVRDRLIRNASDSASALQVELYKNAFLKTTSNTRASLPEDRCIIFSYSELAAITDNFSLAKQIGKGGFATVFLGEWQGQKVAVKKMKLEAQKEFESELQILSSVHHANLVDLIGFCTEGHLFLVYEFVENGTLTHHLQPGTEPMTWTARVQVALDAARGIEYMHDHALETYIHRDLKPSNILLDSKFRAKVGDFGLTRLLDKNGDGWAQTLIKAGTFGYLAPEYAQFGTLSVKLDVYAFGVVLYQIVSGKQAIIGTSVLLTSLFEEILNNSNADDEWKRLVDPALGADYPVESVRKMVSLAERCTQKKAELRPQMSEVVMQLMALSDTHLLTQAA